MGSHPRLSMAGMSGPSAEGTSETRPAPVPASRRSKGTCSRGASSPASSPHVVARASASAASSSNSSPARSRTRRGSTSTTRASSPKRSVTSSSDSTSQGSHDSMPSNCSPSANRSHWCRPHGAVPTSVPACLRMASSVTNSRQPKICTSARSSIDRWSATSKRVNRSTSSPHRSMRIGLSMVDGKTSTIPPRTASSPRCSTIDSRR